MDMDGPAAYHSVDYSRSLANSYIFIATLFLSLVGWVTCLISQAIVAAQIGNDSVGTLWFAVVLQVGVILGLVVSWFNDTLFQYGIALSIFAALASSYGAQGVHLNVFAGTSARNALSAGWLITCIVDVFWILILSSEPSSFVYRFVATNGYTKYPSGHANNGVTNVGTPLEAFSQSKYTTDGIPPNELPVAPRSTGVSNTGSRSHSRVAGDAESHRRRSEGVWNSAPHTPGEGRPDSTRDVPPIPNISIASIGTGTSILAPVAPSSEGARPTSGSNLATTRSDNTTTAATPVPLQPLPRAQVLFDCK